MYVYVYVHIYICIYHHFYASYFAEAAPEDADERLLYVSIQELAKRPHIAAGQAWNMLKHHQKMPSLQQASAGAECPGNHSPEVCSVRIAWGQVLGAELGTSSCKTRGVTGLDLGQLLETPWISQITQIGHGFYLFIYCSILGLLHYIPLKKILCNIVCIDNGKYWPWQQLLQDGNEGQRTFKTAAGYENAKVPPSGLGSHSHQVLGNICRRLLCECFSTLLTYG